jgi:hypothetical protein
VGLYADHVARQRTTSTPEPDTTGVPVVGAREPCPCGSGRRYKACHGRANARAEHTRTLRPFAGLPAEPDWIALREIVPAATAALTLTGEYAGRQATLATVLPMAWPALVRSDGQVMVALQTSTASGDLSADVADALVRALEAEPGTPVAPRLLPADGPRLNDLLDPGSTLPVTVHEGFDFWLDGLDASVVDEATRESMQRANEAVVPTARLAGVEAAYWCQIGQRWHLRWVMPEDEDVLLDALARLAEASALEVGEGSRYVGSFRAYGHLVPVWDLAPDTAVEAVEAPAVAFRRRLDEALSTTTALTAQQRRARSALVGRQVTLRPGA